MADNIEKKISEFISEIVAAVSNCSLYSSAHSSVKDFSEKAVTALDSLYKNDEASITLLGDSLHLNDSRITAKGMHMVNFVRRLKRRGIEKIIIKKGATQDEILGLIENLSATGSIASDYQHISIGIVEVGLRGGGGGGGGELIEQGAEAVHKTYEQIAVSGTLDIGGLEEVVMEFMNSLKRDAGVLKAACPVRAHSEYTFTHITNVAVLAMFQAESLGFPPEIVHDMGMAGLLHDMGKVFVSAKIIEKEGKLDDEEWARIKAHPELGAKYLAERPEVPRIAVIGAYEHHMKFDGTGYPRTRRHPRKQHIVSQILTIADFFDALRTNRSYRKAMPVPKAVGIMRESSGKDFNPPLVDHFLRSLQSVGIEIGGAEEGKA